MLILNENAYKKCKNVYVQIINFNCFLPLFQKPNEPLVDPNQPNLISDVGSGSPLSFLENYSFKNQNKNLPFFNGFLLNFSGTSILNNLKLELDMDSNLSPNLGNNGIHIFKTLYRKIKN